jgi:hypothetical protein
MSFLRGGVENLLFPGSSAPTNKELLIELSRAALMQILHERSLDKRRTPDPGEE